MLNLIIGGVLGLPFFAVALGVAPVLAVLSVPPLLVLLFASKDDGEKASKPDQVIITGGSSGIGLSIAKECIQRGVPKITLMARNMKKLEQAKAELEALKTENKSAKIDIVSVSVGDHEALTKVAKDMAIPKTDRVILWNCAGFAYPTEFEKVPIEQFQVQVMTNQLGPMYVTRAFLPYLNKGCVVLTSSACGQLGVYGYTSYSPTKFALRGFAETLHPELIKSHPELSIQLAFPMDTDTPGYQEEHKISPEITKKISESGGTASPEDTAKKMVDAAFCKNPKFQVYFSFEGWLLTNATAGLSPANSLLDAVTQMALGGALRFIAIIFLNDWWNTIRSFSTSSKKGD